MGVQASLGPTEASRYSTSMVATTLVGCALILGLRKPDAFTHPQFWAEDGAEYYAKAAELGLPSLTEPYHGSFWFFQRSVAWTGNLVPALWTPLYYNAIASLAALTIAGYIVCAKTDLTFRPVLALLPLAAPVGPEVFACLTNVHWIFALAFPVMVLARDPSSRIGRVAEIGFLAVLGLTGPLVVLVLPLFAARLVARRSVHSGMLLATACTCAAIQMLELQTDRTKGAIHLGDPYWLYWGGDLVRYLLVPQRYAQELALSGWLAFVAAALWGALLWHTCACRDGRRLALLALAVAVLAVTAYAHRGHPDWIAYRTGTRYGYVPVVVFLWCLVLTLSYGKRPAILAGATLLWIMVVAVPRFRFAPPEDCHWAAGIAQTDGTGPRSLRLNPAGWYMEFRPKSED